MEDMEEARNGPAHRYQAIQLSRHRRRRDIMRWIGRLQTRKVGIVGPMEMGGLMERLMGVPMLRKDFVESIHRTGSYVNSDRRWLVFWVFDGLVKKWL